MASMRTILTRTALVLTLATPTLALTEDKAATPAAPTNAQASLEGVTLQGTVLETMNSNGYTYLQLDAKQGKIWVAIPETQLKAGQTVTCAPGMPMYNFSSKTLNRTFETIIFSPGLDKGNATPTAQPAAEAARTVELLAGGGDLTAAAAAWPAVEQAVAQLLAALAARQQNRPR